MKLKLNKNSWHYFLAHKLGNYEAPYVHTYSNGETVSWGDSADLCTYSRCVMGAILLLIIGIATVTLMSALFWSIVFGIYFSILTGMWIMNPIGEATLFVLCVGSATFSIYNFFGWLSDQKERESDGFVRHAYSAWKNKFCLKIDFED